MRYAFPGARPRSDEALEKYERFGTGTVLGSVDPHKEVELSFFRDMQNNGGISNEQVHASAHRFKEHYTELEARLADSPYLLGTDLSLLDIAWYIYSVRLANAGYPLHELHPRIGSLVRSAQHATGIGERSTDPPPMVAAREQMHQQQQADGQLTQSCSRHIDENSTSSNDVCRVRMYHVCFKRPPLGETLLSVRFD